MPDEQSMNLAGQSLKAIANPLRFRLLSLLRDDGPSTATRLAELVGESSGVTSYHLRELAKHGFVAEDESLGTGRDRWWKAVVWQTVLEAPAVRDSPVESEAYMRAVAAHEAERVDRWLHEVTALPTEWERAADMSSAQLRLTPAEATRLVAELRTVAEKYRRDAPDVEAPDDAERVVLQFQVMPFVRGSNGRPS